MLMMCSGSGVREDQNQAFVEVASLVVTWYKATATRQFWSRREAHERKRHTNRQTVKLLCESFFINGYMVVNALACGLRADMEQITEVQFIRRSENVVRFRCDVEGF